MFLSLEKFTNKYGGEKSRLLVQIFASAFFLCCMMFCYTEVSRGEVKNLYFEADSYVGTQYEPYISAELHEDERLTYRILTGYKYIGYRTGDFSVFWDLEVDGKATTKQFRYTSLDTAVGMRIDKLDIFVRHKSEHMLEHRPVAHFPLENYIGIRWNLIRKGE
jgi:hypothetical protein